jgi:hypothetical protein
MDNTSSHRTGKPYTHADIDFLIRRGTTLDIYESGMVYLHLEHCPECEQKISPYLDQLFPDQPR